MERALADASIRGVADVELAVNSMLGAAHREPYTWDKIAKTKWAPRIVGTWMAIVTTLGDIGAVPALMPGDDPTPVQINNSVVVNELLETDDVDVVDAELVDDAGSLSNGEDDTARK